LRGLDGQGHADRDVILSGAGGATMISYRYMMLRGAAYAALLAALAIYAVL